MKSLEIPFYYHCTFFNSVNVIVEDFVKIPLQQTVNDVFFWFVVKHDIPEYATESFKNFIMEFIETEIHKFQSCEINKSIELIHDVNHMSTVIKNQYCETWSIYRPPVPQSDLEIFGNTYLRLVENGTEGMESIARLELQFSRALSEKVAQRDLVLANLEEQYSSTMKELEKTTGVDKQSDINKFEQQFHQNRFQMEINWNSDISALREEQKRDFRSFIMNASSSLLLNSPSDIGDDKSQTEVNTSGMANSTSMVTNKKHRNSYDLSCKTKHINRSKSSSIFLSKLSDLNKKLGIIQDQTLPVQNKTSRSSLTPSVPLSDHLPWEESFTIHLGRQLRSTHNMRIICVEPLDLLSLSTPSSDLDNNNDMQPEIIASRINTALSLYSRNLTGMVLLVDSRLNTYSGMKNKFAHLCEVSTDFHFPQLEYQLEEIKKILIFSNQRSPDRSSKSSQCLSVGDVYITCHSNLNVVAVVFHLVIDEADVQKDIRFPSPIHNAIRNILRTCFLYDIFCLNMPLLLTHGVKEYMNHGWCIRRVETILKAVKGAMMELCTWKGREPRTIQFIVPPGLSEEMLASFSSLLTDYFQLSKAVK